jgi:hypothetical protein
VAADDPTPRGRTDPDRGMANPATGGRPAATDGGHDLRLGLASGLRRRGGGSRTREAREPHRRRCPCRRTDFRREASAVARQAGPGKGWAVVGRELRPCRPGRDDAGDGTCCALYESSLNENCRAVLTPPI